MISTLIFYKNFVKDNSIKIKLIYNYILKIIYKKNKEETKTISKENKEEIIKENIKEVIIIKKVF